MSRVTDRIRRSLENHKLEEIPAGDRTHIFRMSNGKDWCHLNEFIFTPRGHIVICGDTIISDHSHGIVSCVGYGLGWFANQLSEDYLCEKFFRRDEFDLEDCIEDLKYQLEGRDEESACYENLSELIREFEEDWCPEETERNEAYTAIAAVEVDLLGDSSPGMGYPRNSAAWLCALQQRFAELIPTVM